MEFYEDPLDFDINEAKARKAREEAGNDLEKQAQLELDEANEKDGLLSDGNKKSEKMTDIKLGNRELDDRVTESFAKNSLLSEKNLDVLKL